MSARRRREAIPLPAPAAAVAWVPAPPHRPHWHKSAVQWTTRAQSLLRRMRKFPRHSIEWRDLRNQAQTAHDSAEAVHCITWR